MTSQKPLLHWLLASGDDGARVEIYRDRACTEVVTTFTATGTSGAPASPLAAGLYYWRLRGTRGSITGDATSPVWEFIVGARSAPTDTSWGTLLDVNGDGFPDVAAGTPNINSLKGAVRLRLGSASGPDTTPTTIDVPAGDTAPFPEFGTSVASAGDVNGDGFADLLVGAPGGGAPPGAAYVYLGGAGGLSPTPMALPTATMPQGFGWGVSSGGDINGDGYADVVVIGPGSTYVYLGSESGPNAMPTVLSTPQASSVASAGDLNGDGFGDVVVGANYANQDAGAVYIFLGGVNGLSSTPITIDNPTGAYGFFGYSVASAGDVDGDGLADLVIGAPGVTPAAYLYLGRTTGVSATPITLGSQGGPTDTLTSPSSEEFGATVAGVGDVNGDGFADFVVSCPALGSAYLYRGSSTGVSMTPSAVLVTSFGYGTPVAGVGDVNTDGFADLAFGGFGGVGIYLGSQGALPTMPIVLTETSEVSSIF